MRPGLHAATLALLVAAISVVGCSPSRDSGPAELELQIRTEPTPPTVGSTQLVVTVTDLAWHAVNGASVTISGHPVGQPEDVIAVTAEGRGAGQYFAPGVDFTIPGTWMVTVRVELRGGLWKEREESFEVRPASD